MNHEVWNRQYERIPNEYFLREYTVRTLTCEKRASLSPAKDRRCDTLQLILLVARLMIIPRRYSVFPFSARWPRSERWGFESQTDRPPRPKLRSHFWHSRFHCFLKTLLVPEISSGRTFAGNGGCLFSMTDFKAFTTFSPFLVTLTEYNGWPCSNHSWRRNFLTF